MIRSLGRNSTMSVISRQLSMKPLASSSQGMWRCDGVDGVVEPTKKDGQQKHGLDAFLVGVVLFGN